MKSRAPPPIANDGGIVAALVMLMAALAVTMVASICLYASKSIALARLISGWANFGNAVVHSLLVILLASNAERFLKAGIDDAEELTGPIALGVINGLVGLRALNGAGPNVSFGWNTFVAFTGSLLPVVWPKFLDMGMSQWPYILIFLWLGIYAFESLAFFTSVAWFAMKDASK